MKCLLVLFLIVFDCVRSQYNSNFPSDSNLNDNSVNSANLNNLTLIDIFGLPTENKDRSFSDSFGNQNPILETGTQNCRCVERRLCTNSDGYGSLGIRGPNCNSFLEICCEEKDIIIIPPKGCGNRYAEGVGSRISNVLNNDVQFGEFPWMLAILIEEVNDKIQEKLQIFKCGASLIHPEVVLTSAHCVDTINPATLLIRAGEWKVNSTNELYPHQDRGVKNIIIHPNFRKRGLHNDVALIHVKSPFKLAANVEPVCLPSQDEVLEDLKCIATGWGKNSFGQNSTYQVILKKVELPIVPRDICQERLRTSKVGMYFILDESLICAEGETGKDTCTGDGGSPLVCPIPGKRGKYQQRGLVAWGIECGGIYPGAYGNVAHFRNWIDKEMMKLNLDTSTYTI